MSLSRLLIWPRALSAVAMSWSARWLLLIAVLALVMSRRRFSLAIKPAGSSLPELIRRPVLSRLSGGLQLRVRAAEGRLSNQGTDIRVDTAHELTF